MGKRISLGTILVIIIALAKLASYSQKTSVQTQTNIAVSDSCPAKEVEAYFEKATSIWESFDYEEESAYGGYLSYRNMEYPPCLKKLNDLSVSFFYNAWRAAQEHNEGNQSNAANFVSKAEQIYAEMEAEADRLASEYGSGK